NALLDTVVNNSGIIRAHSLVERNGEIVLDGGTAGVVSNSGTLTVAGTDAGTTGGTVKVLGQYAGLFDGSKIDASGDAGGGTVLVGGNFHGAGSERNASHTFVGSNTSINANAVNTGNGGQVAVWSNDGTKFFGSISARGGAQAGNGGSIEVSGKHGLVFRGVVDTRAPNGRTGTLLLDPDDITILAADNTYSGTTDLSVVTGSSGVWASTDDPGPQTIGDQYISNLLGTTSVSLSATATITAQSGATLSWVTANALTLDAGTNITLNDASFTALLGSLNLKFGKGGSSGALALGTSNLTGLNAVSIQAGDGATNAAAYTISRAGGNTWNLAGTDQGSINGVGAAGGALNFSNVGNLADGGAGTFNMGAAGAVSGSVTAVSGTLNFASYATDITVSLTGANAGAATGIGTSFSGISAIDANGANSNTMGGTGNVYLLDDGTPDKGSSQGVAWTAFKNINDATGTVNFQVSGSVSGNMTAQTLNYSTYGQDLTLDITAGTITNNGVGGTLSGFSTVNANPARNNTVGGSGEVYTLTNGTPNAGTGATYTWTAFKNINDATGTVDFQASGSVTGSVSAATLDYSTYGSPVSIDLTARTASAIGTTWSGVSTINANAAQSNTIGGSGEVYTLTDGTPNAGSNGAVSWTNFRNISDATGTVDFQVSGSVTGSVTADTLNYSSYGSPVTFDRANGGGLTTGIGGTWSGVTSVTGSGNTSDTVHGNGTTYNTFNVATKGIFSAGGVAVSGFESISDSGAANVDMSGTTSGGVSGNVTTSGGSVTLGAGNQVGGNVNMNNAGTLHMGTAGTVSGSVSTGTLDYASYGAAVSFNLNNGAGTTTGVGTTWSGVTTVTGSGGTDTVAGTNKTYNLTAANAGNSGGISWTSFEKIADAGTGTISTAGGQVYNVTGANAGNVTTLLPGGFTGIGNLTDSGAATVKFTTNAARVSNDVTTTGGALDYSAGITGPVT